MKVQYLDLTEKRGWGGVVIKPKKKQNKQTNKQTKKRKERGKLHLKIFFRNIWKVFYSNILGSKSDYVTFLGADLY